MHKFAREIPGQRRCSAVVGNLPEWCRKPSRKSNKEWRREAINKVTFVAVLRMTKVRTYFKEPGIWGGQLTRRTFFCTSMNFELSHVPLRYTSDISNAYLYASGLRKGRLPEFFAGIFARFSR